MDEIVGIAVLTDVNPSDGYEYLFVTCSSPSRKTIQTSAIPIRAKGIPNPGNRCWQYVVRGDYLDVTPSLKISYPRQDLKPEREIFHNSGAWSVKFVRKTMDEASDELGRLNFELVNKLREQWGLAPVRSIYHE
jgi:hypothetical protein